MTRRILLLSAYDALSHRHWRNALTEMFPELAWTQLTLPPRHFSWRVRGNGLSWGVGQTALLEKPYDLLIATSLVDLASLRGLVPTLARVPTIVYFHENQFAYPRSAAQQAKGYDTTLDAALVSLYAALCADRVVFNSHYNRATFLAGTEQLLDRLPDQVPPGILDRLADATTLPVPLPAMPATFGEARPRRSETLHVAWNHRWEYDKGPGLLLALVQRVAEEKLPIRFHLMGQQFRQQPAEFKRLSEELSRSGQPGEGWIANHGYIPARTDYLEQLAGCDVVLSTALHDFQGLAILEGCAMGCTPLCPDQLVYPEYLDERFLYPAVRGDEFAPTLRVMLARLRAWQALKQAGRPLPTFDPRAFTRETLQKSYLALFKDLWQPQQEHW